MTPFDGFLSGTRGALLVRNLILRVLNRPRLKVEALVANVWVGDANGAPLTLVASVANPSPHPLTLSHIGVEIEKGDMAFPDELKTILGPLAQFDSRSVSMTVKALEEFIGQFAEGHRSLETVRNRRQGRTWEGVVL